MNYLTYFLYIGIIILLCIGFYFIFRNKSKKTQTIAISILLFSGLIVHFLKLLIPEYKNDISNMFVHVTLNTPCAVTTIAFPFIFLSKNDKAKDFMVIFGFLSGLLTILIPTEIMDHPTFDIETIRFYFAHAVILMSSLFMYLFKLHTFTNHWLKNTLIGTLIISILVLLNNVIIYVFIFKEPILQI